MNLFDLAAIGLLVLAGWLGYRSGAIPQIGGLAGAITGAGLAIVAFPHVEPLLRDLDPMLRAFAVLTGLIFSVGVGEAVGSAAGHAVKLGLGPGALGAADRVGGTFVGCAQGLLIVWLAGGLLATGPDPRLATQAQTSTAVRALAAILPPPTEIAAGLGRVLDASGLPDVFIGLEPVPAPPVDRPTTPETLAIAALAEASTFRVVARTCDLQSTGTGFVAGPGYVVTNAHVIAGASAIRLSQDGQTVDAIPVLFDAQLDVAVLRAPGLNARPLRFSPIDPERGIVGAALGHPGGAGLSAIPAAVASGYDALGRDIYGSQRVSRRILELRAEIERGDSGGPFILRDGTVGGVVFAESRTDPEVGYALAASDVAPIVAGALTRTQAVPTGPCLS